MNAIVNSIVRAFEQGNFYPVVNLQPPQRAVAPSPATDNRIGVDALGALALAAYGIQGGSGSAAWQDGRGTPATDDQTGIVSTPNYLDTANNLNLYSPATNAGILDGWNLAAPSPPTDPISGALYTTGYSAGMAARNQVIPRFLTSQSSSIVDVNV